ncbi:MAG TPA: hypothetical protein VGG06_21660 [Thermoanaerobaculia bacterium]|jgi:hypothetical protein
MPDDPIVEVFRRAGNEYAAGFGHDLDAIFKDLKKRQKERGAHVVSFADASRSAGERSDRNSETPVREATG